MIVRVPSYIVNFFGILFVPAAWKLRESDLVHEGIHTAQMKELLYIGFYLLYFFEWVFRLIFYTRTAYRGISFEREAYDHEGDGWEYLKTRKHFAQWRKDGRI